MRPPITITTKYSKKALGDDPLSSTAKSWSTDRMNIGDATYADAPKHPPSHQPSGQNDLPGRRQTLDDIMSEPRQKHRGMPGQLHRHPQTID
jgi:hypothetical protein